MVPAAHTAENERYSSRGAVTACCKRPELIGLSFRLANEPIREASGAHVRWAGQVGTQQGKGGSRLLQRRTACLLQAVLEYAVSLEQVIVLIYSLPTSTERDHLSCGVRK
jgi:hypothetical protein